MMPNGFDGMGRMPNFAGNMNPEQMLQAFKSNPAQFLMRRFNFPQNMPMNDPNAILNHLLQTGQVNQEQINNAYKLMGQFGKR